MNADKTQDEAIQDAVMMRRHRPFVPWFVARWPDETGWHAFGAPTARKAKAIVRKGGEAAEVLRDDKATA